MENVKPTQVINLISIFRNKENEEILLDFLNAVTKDSSALGERVYIENIESLNPLNQTNEEKENTSYLKIKAKTNLREPVLFEIRIVDVTEVENNRIFMYWSKAYSEQAEQNKDRIEFEKLCRTITINIMDCEKYGKLHSVFHFSDGEGIKLFKDIFEIHLLELPQINKTEKILDNKLAEWILYLKNPMDERMEEIKKKNQNIQKAFEASKT